MPGRIFIGTSGWSYPRGEGTWNGYFYPAGKIRELEFYGQFFDTVEVNSTFYRPPDPGFVAGWAKRVPPGFLFAVKLWQKFTHPQMYKRATGEEAAVSSADVELFQRCLEPLVKAQKLGVVLGQFPPSFKNDLYGQQVIDGLSRAFGQYRLAVELRNRSWSDDPGMTNFMKMRNVAWVQIDEPRFGSSIAADLPLTADFAYFRFHGRNARDWWSGNVETRYCYLYSPREIQQLAEKVKLASLQTRMVFAFFNNHWKAYAPRNANDMKKVLQLSFSDLPAPLEALTTDSGEGAR